MSTIAPPARTEVHHGVVDAAPPPKEQRDHLPGLVSQVLFAFAVLLSWLLFYLTVLSGFEQSHDQHRLYDQLRSQLAEGTAPTGAPIEAGAPVALVAIPSIGVRNLVVVEGTRADQLKEGPGHALGSVLPGQQGVSVLMGRSLTFGAPFAGLTSLRPDDTIQVVTAQGEFNFRVIGSRRAGDTVPEPVGAGESRLMLVTAAGEGPLAGLRPSQTYYVDALLEGKAVAAGRTALADSQGIGMSPHVSAGLLAQLALAIQLLVVVLVGAIWAWYRWSKVAAWVTGLPAVLAALWLTASLVSRLLPAMI